MPAIRTARLPFLLLAALGAAGCSDSAVPTGPAEAAALAAPGRDAAITAAARPTTPSRKAPYIASLVVGNDLRIVPGGSSPYTMVITNPTPKVQSEIYVQATLLQNGTLYGAGGSISGCPEFSGQAPPGDCTVNYIYVADPTIGLGAATLEIQLLLYNRKKDQTSVLDSRTFTVTVEPVFQ